MPKQQPNLAMIMEKIEALEKQHDAIKRRLFVMSLFSYLKLALIAIPLIFAIIYLPPVVREMIDVYQGILGINVGAPDHCRSTT